MERAVEELKHKSLPEKRIVWFEAASFPSRLLKCVPKSSLCRKNRRDPDAWRHVLLPRRKRPRRGRQVALQVFVFDGASSASDFVPALLIPRPSSACSRYWYSSPHETKISLSTSSN